MFSDAEQKFIDEMNARFPGRSIRENFSFYARLDPALRLSQAENDAKKILRAGWVRIGVPAESHQSIFEHEQAAGHFIMLFAARHCIADAQAAINIALNHDKPCEAIVSDFTPHDSITKPEKARLEDMAARIVLEAYPEIYALWREYEDGVTLSAHIAHDADQMEMLTRALYIEERHPQMHDALTPFWQSAARRLHTPMAKQEYAELVKVRSDGVTSVIYEDMRTHYQKQKISAHNRKPGIKA
jgi:putative hydrolases of HD superfamily